jgi:hypothetical protein
MTEKIAPPNTDLIYDNDGNALEQVWRDNQWVALSVADSQRLQLNTTTDKKEAQQIGEKGGLAYHADPRLARLLMGKEWNTRSIDRWMKK